MAKICISITGAKNSLKRENFGQFHIFIVFITANTTAGTWVGDWDSATKKAMFYDQLETLHGFPYFTLHLKSRPFYRDRDRNANPSRLLNYNQVKM